MGNSFSKGDKVMVRKDLKVGERYGGIEFRNTMTDIQGKPTQVAYVGDHRYILRGSPFLWPEIMLEKVE